MHLLPFFSALTITLLPLGRCVPTTSTCSTTSILRDPGFESGVSPPPNVDNPSAWGVYIFFGSSTYALSQPGSTLPNGGNYAFTAILYPTYYSRGLSSETLTQTMTLCAGKNYSVLVDYKFDSQANGNCDVAIKYPFKDTQGSVTTGSGLSPAGIWYTTGSTFQAVSAADRFDVVFTCRSGANNRISVDNVKVAPYKGNAY